MSLLPGLSPFILPTRLRVGMDCFKGVSVKKKKKKRYNEENYLP
jgi:hypothetical protein